MLRPPLPILLLCVASSTIAHAAENGLILRFGDADARVARQVALYVPEGQAASPFMEPGQIEAVWEGNLNLEARSRLIFNLEGTGTAELTIDDERLCESIGTPSERKRLSSGAHPIRIRYTGPASGDAQLRLYWEGREFSREPVPPSAFTHDPGDAQLVAQSAARRGHDLIAQHNCASCHGEPAAPGGPSLTGVGERLEASWLAGWIENPHAHRPNAKMPRLFQGEGAKQKAIDVAAYLSGTAAPAPAPPNGNADKGAELFHQQGCIGCHTLDAKGDAERIGMGEIGSKFRPGALAAFLRDPAKHHAATRMPDFGFDEPESAALEAYLRSLAKTKPTQLPKGDPARGEQLFKQSGCLNCHQHGDSETELRPLDKVAKASCDAAGFALSATELEAITAALAKPEFQRVPAEVAMRQFESLRCAACHERDGKQPYRELFAKEVAHLAPEEIVDEEKPGTHMAAVPPLDHLGVKLRPGWRTALFKGTIKPKTRPWLKARMPAFAHHAELLSHGFSHAAGLPHTGRELPPPDPAKVKIGAELTGLTGLACGTCHGVGDKPAIAVFEGEGPNFRDAGVRLTGEYLHLWMNDPPRVWPGTIMPKYATGGLTPLTQHYEGDATRQFDAIYHYLRSLAK